MRGAQQVQNGESFGDVNLARAVERLVSTDLPGRGFSQVALQAASGAGDIPAIALAAKDLDAALRATSSPVVVISTGASKQRAGLPAHIGEMDGPPGAVALARFLGRAYSCAPVLLTEEGQALPLARVAESVGLHCLDFESLCVQAREAKYTSAVTVMEFSSDDDRASEQALRILDDLKPSALVAIEKAGRNEKGVFHNTGGKDTSEGKARVDSLFDEALRRGLLTIGIGDGGNEIGMGNLRQELIRLMPDLARCSCGCGGSIIASSETTHLIVATVSNWGVYGLITYMANALGIPEATHTSWLETRALNAAAQAGYVNIDGYCLPEVDGLPLETHTSILSLLGLLAKWPFIQHARDGYARNHMVW